jgi:hypothetical protein
MPTPPRRRYCSDCLSARHVLEYTFWHTEFGRLVRTYCNCAECDCPYLRLRIQHPLYDQRHAA